MDQNDIRRVTLDSFIGQKNIIENLKISIAAAEMRNEILGHILLSGPEGSGKTTIAYAIGYTIGTNVNVSSAKEMVTPGDLAAILTRLCDGDVLIIKDFDKIHEECLPMLCSAMKKFCLEKDIGKGLLTRHIQLDLPKFTVIGVTDKSHKLSLKVKDCFYLDFSLVDYTKDELVQLAKKWCVLNKIEITHAAAESVALYAGGSNKKLIYILKRARDFAMVINNKIINFEVAKKTIDSLLSNDFT